MTKLFWVLGTALIALIITRVALRSRSGGRSPLNALAREYLGEQLAARGIAHRVPARYIAEIAERYAGAVEVRPLGRIAAASQLMRNIDAAVAFIEQWLQDGREFPPSIAQMALPALGVPEALQEPDVPDPDN